MKTSPLTSLGPSPPTPMPGGSSRGGPAKHPSVGGAGKAGGQRVRHRGGAGQEGEPKAPQSDGLAAYLPTGPNSSDTLCLHSQAHLLAQPDRAVVFYSGAQAAQAKQFYVRGRSAPADPRFHRVLQPGSGQTVQMDVQGPSAESLNRWIISTAMH